MHIVPIIIIIIITITFDLTSLHRVGISFKWAGRYISYLILLLNDFTHRKIK